MPTNFQQQTRFKSVREQKIEEFNFTGGLVTDEHETKLNSSQSPDLANVRFNTTGSIKTRNGQLRYNTNPVGATADQSNTGASTGSLAIDAVGDYVAQTFIPSGAISTVQVDIYCAMQTVGQEQLIRVELWSTSAGAPSTLLNNGVGQIKLVSGTSETAYNFRFKLPVSESAATTYAIVVKPFVRGTTQTVNQVNVYHRGSTYANGQVYTSTDSGLTWTGDSAKDLRFVVYSGGNVGGTGLIRYYNDTGLQQLIAKVGGNLYRGNDSTGVMTSLTLGNGSTLNADSFIDYTIFNGTLLVVDNSSKIQKYNGSTNANYTTGTISVTNASPTVTGSGTSWSTTTNVEVGEYIKLPDGKWYRIIGITSDTSLTIEINYQGSSLSAQSYTISPWGEVQGKLNSSVAPASLVCPTPKYIESHLNRVWTLEGNTLRFSTLDTSVNEECFNDWDTSNNAGTIIIPSGEGDTGTGLYSANGYLYVFQRNALWEILGNSPSNFELRNLNNEIGMTDRRTLVEYDRVLIFLSKIGVVVFDGASISNLTDGVINNSIADWANMTSPVACLWNNNYIISYTPSGSSTNSEAIFYDIARKIWGRMTSTYAAVWSVWDGGSDTGQVYYISANQGSIYQWDVGGHDDGYEIESYYDTGSLGFGAGINDKAMKKFYIQQVARGDWDMNVTQVADLGQVTTNGTAINLSGGTSSLWDVFEWDVDSWSGEGELLTDRVAEFQGIAKYFRFKLSQTGYNEGIEVLGLVVTSRLRRLQ
jgi:hypothetical protein